MAAVGFGGAQHGGVVVDDANTRGRWRHGDREDTYLGRWSYARKGKRTAAQIQRAARKKRNRKRNK